MRINNPAHLHSFVTRPNHFIVVPFHGRIRGEVIRLRPLSRIPSWTRPSHMDFESSRAEETTARSW